MTYFPASLASMHQSRRTISRPFSSCAVTYLSPTLLTVKAAYFFFFSNNMDLKTPSMSISSNLYNLFTSFFIWKVQEFQSNNMIHCLKTQRCQSPAICTTYSPDFLSEKCKNFSQITWFIRSNNMTSMFDGDLFRLQACKATSQCIPYF